MPSLQIIRPVVGRRVVIELPEDWEDVQVVDITLAPHQAELPEEQASSLYQALETIGFIGCVDTDERLSTTYKQQLDFSNKCG
jgi:hypothetical protein